MAIPRQITSNSVSVAATTNVKAFASNVVAGNLLFLVLGNRSGNFASTVTDSQGNTWINQDVQGTGGVTVETWFVIAGSSGPCTVTATYGTAKISDLIIAEYSASGGTPALDVSTSNQATVGTSIDTNTINTNVAQELLIAWAYDGTRSTAWTDSAGYTAELTTNNGAGAALTLFDTGVAATGAYHDNMTATSGVSGDGLVAGIISFTHIAVSVPLAVSCNTPPTGYVGSVYTHSFVASGGTAPYTYSISVGALPAGLALNAGTGAVTGTPTAAGTTNFTVKATDSAAGAATAACSITVRAASKAPFLSLTQSSIARLQAMFDNTKSVGNLQLLNLGGTLLYLSKQSYPFLTGSMAVTAYKSDVTGLIWSAGAQVNTGQNSPASGSSTAMSMTTAGGKVYVVDSQQPLDGIGGLNYTLGVWAYDPVANTWSGPSPGGPFFDQTGDTAVLALANGTLLVVYTVQHDAFITDSTVNAVVYNPASNTWGAPVTLANYGHAAGQLRAYLLAALHDSGTDHSVIYFIPGSVNSTASNAIQAFVLGSTGTLLNTPSAIYTTGGVSSPIINGAVGVPTLTTDSPSGGLSAAFPYRDGFSSPAGNIVMLYVDVSTFAQALEAAAFQGDFTPPNVISQYTQQDQGAWVALQFGGFLYLAFTVDNGILNNASSQNFLYVKSRGGSATWSGLQKVYTSALSREGLQSFAASWTTAGPAILLNNWDPTNNPQSGTIAGLSSFILLPGAITPTKLEISLFGTKREVAKGEPGCVEHQEPPPVKLFCA